MPEVQTMHDAIHAVATADAAAAVGPYSQAVRAGGFLFVSGQVGIDPGTGEMVPGDVRAQAEQSIGNIKAILLAAGTDITRVVKTTVLLADMSDFMEVNDIYARHFGGSVLPARATYEVAALPLGARIEIELIAAV